MTSVSLIGMVSHAPPSAWIDLVSSRSAREATNASSRRRLPDVYLYAELKLPKTNEQSSQSNYTHGYHANGGGETESLA